MRSLPMLSILLLGTLNPSSCTPEQVDSFCQLYEKVIVEKGDGRIIASEGVKKRLLLNETFYVQNCKGKA